jgi:hypothetical protein
VCGAPPPSRTRATDGVAHIVRWLVLEPSLPPRPRGAH